MLRKVTVAKLKFRVVCVWCGSEIRKHRHGDEQGICLKCFYKILGDHLMAQRRSRYGEFESDR
jgi:hypothetical protein